MNRSGWPDARIEKVSSESPLRVPAEVWRGRATRRPDPAEPT